MVAELCNIDLEQLKSPTHNYKKEVIPAFNQAILTGFP